MQQKVKDLFEYINTKCPELPRAIKETKVISDESEETLKKAIVDFKAEYLK